MSLDTSRLAGVPFETCADGQRPYVGAAQRSALATLSQSLSEPGTLTLLAAPAGYGKSTLLDLLLDELGELLLWSHVRGPLTDPVEFLRAVVLGFGFDECSGTRDQLRRILEVFLTHHWQNGGCPVLIVDNAQSLAPLVLEELRWLAALRGDNQAALNVMLSGLPELRSIVHAPAMEALAARQLNAVEIHALGEADTGAYIRHRLALAGATDPGQVFEEPAVSLIHRYTGGIPALVNTLCQSALNCATAAGQSRVTKTSVVDALGQLHGVAYPSPVVSDDAGGEAEKKVDADAGLGRLIVTNADELLTDYCILKERVLIGRRPDNDLALNSVGVSRYHALMLLDADGWMLIDLHSLNGTYVNARRTQQHRLTSGDMIRIADVEIRCLHDLGPAAPHGDVDVDSTAMFDPVTLRPVRPRGAWPRLVKSS